MPDCAAAHLTYDANNDVWQGTFSLPAGNYEYKAALNDSWDENYGLHAVPGGSNIPRNFDVYNQGFLKSLRDGKRRP